MSNYVKLPNEEPGNIDETSLACPSCGGNYIHVGNMRASYGDSAVRVNSSGIHLEEWKTPMRGPGAAEITFSCEFCDDLSKIHIGFHKGNTHIWTEVIGNETG